MSSEPLTVDRAAVKAVASWVFDDDDFDEAMAALEDALHARYRTKTVADLSDAVAATPSSEEADVNERKASEFREIEEDDAPTYADGCTVPLDRDGIAIFPIPEHVHEPPLATPDNAGRSSIDVERLAEAICGSRLPFVEEDGDLYVDDACRSWARKAIAEYARLSGSARAATPARSDAGDGLDVERLARALEVVDDMDILPSLHAAEVAAEYARLAATQAPETEGSDG